MNIDHRIKRQIVELELPDEQLDLAARRAMGLKIGKAFELAVDKYYPQADSDVIYRISALDFDFGTFTLEELQNEQNLSLQEKVDVVVERELPTLLASSGVEVFEVKKETETADPATQQAGEALEHFLTTGVFPWWARKEAETVMANLSALDYKKIMRALQNGSEHSPTLVRLLHHFTDRQLLAWAAAYWPAHADDYVSDLLQKLQTTDVASKYRAAIWRVLLSINQSEHDAAAVLNGISQSLYAVEGFEASALYDKVQKDKRPAASRWRALWKDDTLKKQSAPRRSSKSEAEGRQVSAVESFWEEEKEQAEKQLHALHKLLERTTFVTEDWNNIVKQLEALTTFSQLPGLEALVQDLLPIVRHHKTHFARQDRGLLSTDQGELKTLLSEVEALFEYGTLKRSHQADWHSLSQAILEAFEASSLTPSSEELTPPIQDEQSVSSSASAPSPEWENLISLLWQWIATAPDATDTASLKKLIEQPASLTSLEALKKLYPDLLARGEAEAEFEAEEVAWVTQGARVWQALSAPAMASSISSVPSDHGKAQKTNLTATQSFERKGALKPFPDLDAILSLWRTWKASISLTREAELTLQKVEQFVTSHRFLAPEKAWQAFRSEAQWLIREGNKQLANKPQRKGRAKKTAGSMMMEKQYISNAGLVIIWSFIPRLLENLELTESDQFISTEKHERALMLLHLLTTGQHKTTENELLFNKVLLGWPITEPCAVAINPTTEELEIVTDLLEAIIKYNPMMKDSDVDSLRGNFLVRDGGLMDAPDSWQLQVEEKPYDLLLQKFPWSWQTVKTPWMEKPMLVDWKL